MTITEKQVEAAFSEFVRPAHNSTALDDELLAVRYARLLHRGGFMAAPAGELLAIYDELRALPIGRRCAIGATAQRYAKIRVEKIEPGA